MAHVSVTYNTDTVTALGSRTTPFPFSRRPGLPRPKEEEASPRHSKNPVHSNTAQRSRLIPPAQTPRVRL